MNRLSNTFCQPLSEICPKHHLFSHKTNGQVLVNFFAMAQQDLENTRIKMKDIGCDCLLSTNTIEKIIRSFYAIDKHMVDTRIFAYLINNQRTINLRAFEAFKKEVSAILFLKSISDYFDAVLHDLTLPGCPVVKNQQTPTHQDNTMPNIAKRMRPDNN